MPWSFDYAGHAITHEDDGCYLIPTPEGAMLRFTRGDMLVSRVGCVYPCTLATFKAVYQALPMCKECKDTALDSFGLCPKCAPSPTEADLVG